MNKEEKEQIASELRLYAKRFDSQNKVAKNLKGVSSATISQILNQNWELITDKMWRTISAQIGMTKRPWQLVETRDFQMMSDLLTITQTESKVFAVVGDAGTGKTEAIKQYVIMNKNAYHLKCANYWTDKYFLIQVLRSMGREYGGMKVAEMMEEVAHYLQQKENPILILDEADKLSDKVLRFFITIYNQLEGSCGFILCSTDHLAKRIKRGVNLNRLGFKEIFSRINRDFIELNGLSGTDIMQVCMANGVNNKVQINAIIRDCPADLRNIKEEIHAIKNIKVA